MHVQGCHMGVDSSITYMIEYIPVINWLGVFWLFVCFCCFVVVVFKVWLKSILNKESLLAVILSPP